MFYTTQSIRFFTHPKNGFTVCRVRIFRTRQGTLFIVLTATVNFFFGLRPYLTPLQRPVTARCRHKRQLVFKRSVRNLCPNFF
jgi:hypothetical protein